MGSLFHFRDSHRAIPGKSGHSGTSLLRRSVAPSLRRFHSAPGFWLPFCTLHSDFCIARPAFRLLPSAFCLLPSAFRLLPSAFPHVPPHIPERLRPARSRRATPWAGAGENAALFFIL